MANQSPATRKERAHNKIVPYYEALAEGFAEMVWPTRCALCDKPGTYLCRDCLLQLSYIDQNFACPLCGAPFGKHLCTECTGYILNQYNRTPSALDSTTSVLLFDYRVQKIITVYKDKGERRLANIFAEMIAESIHPQLKAQNSFITTIPMRKEAKSTRGFDHMDLIAREVSGLVSLPYYPLLQELHHQDQRELGAKQRRENMKGAFTLNSELLISINALPVETISIILIDDVFTTGATLYSAADVLRQRGFKSIHGYTLARVLK
ncbi:MAG: ComF family protein [Anaerotardibacter sp.]